MVMTPSFPVDFGSCAKCAKGKLTKAKRKGLTRNQNLLKILHANIVDLFRKILLYMVSSILFLPLMAFRVF